MLRDVFYYGSKPNAHAREKYAIDLADARQQCTTEHFWIINEYSDYTNFDWDWDFDFLPDDEVWTGEHNNVWPNQYQKDSGTWLCSKQDSEIIIYRSDVEPVYRKNTKHNNWVILDKINELKFDFSWEPNPYDPPYIYKWGCKFYPAEIKHYVEYHVKGATNIKYMTEIVELSPEWNKWVEIQSVDKESFDFSWRPDPREPAYIYVWGNKYISSELQSTLEYHVVGATERKYMDNNVAVLPNWDNWVEVQAVDNKSFDFSWRPDPREPAYIYVWGNKYISSELQPTLEYHVESATERKYMDNSVGVLPNWDNWVEVQAVDKKSFDFSWRPNPKEPAYIYTWGNKYISAELQPTLEYHSNGATERKYMDNSVDVLPEWDKWNIKYSIDKLSFNFSWRPDPREPAFIYVFGNTQYPAEIMSTVEYHVPGAAEYKFIEDDSMRAKLLPDSIRFEHLENSNGIDYSWYPDPWSPPYIYAWGNQWNKPEDKISIQFKVEGATEYKYMEERATRTPCMDNWQIPPYVIKNSFDFSWEPNPKEPAYIYQFGTIHQKTGGPRYIVPGATEVKYIDIIKAKVIAWKFTNWLIPRNLDQKAFDWSWHPDDTEPPYLYQFPNQWSKTGGPRFEVLGATEIKYIETQIAIAKPDMTHWSIPDGIDTTKFDFSWHPDKDHEPLIYQFGTQHQRTGGPIFTAVGCTEDSDIKYVNVTKAKAVITTVNWVTHEDVVDFDYSWHPASTEQPYIYQWGNKHYSSELQPTVEYIVPGATQIKHMSQDVRLKINDKWIEHYDIDKNKFDMTWRPDPTSPPYIYKWGNKHVPVELKATLEYVVDGATEAKYMTDLIEVLPEFDRWKEVQSIDRKQFDLTWRPDPREPEYIYVWGNKWIPGELKSTIEYHVPGATEYKYMDELVIVLPEHEYWIVTQDIVDFDMAWRPDPREPAYIYTWGNKYISAEIKPTLEYYCPGATERKYMYNIEVVPEYDRWIEYQPVDRTKFDMSWRPDPREPAYIYVWGNKWIAGELEPTIEYHVPGAVEKKYMQEPAEVLPISDRWKIIQNVENFDFSWRPDPREPAYIYVWGNKYINSELQPTLEYYVDGATERKYMHNDVVVSPEWNKWNILIPVDKISFDFRWRPDPREPAYIYVWGNKYNEAEREPTIEYHCPGATEIKYMDDKVATTLPEMDKWTMLIPVESFDYSWRPDPKSPPYIYVFGNKWNDSATEPTLEYKVDGANEIKYIDDIVATPKPDLQYWKISNNDDLETFDFSWRPNPHSPPQIYQWADNGPRYTMPDATAVVLMEQTVEIRKAVVNRYKIKTTLEDLINEHPDEVFWAINPDLSYDKFDFGWRPNEENFRHVNVFGNEYSKNTQTYYVNAPLYIMGHKEYNYVEGQTVEIDSNLSMFYIDRGNSESTDRFNILKIRYPQLQKTRYLNGWVDTINRCITKSETKLFWVLNSEIDYSEFEFDFYPSPWQEQMVHVFGTQWSHWGTTFMVNKETFAEDTKYVKIIEHLSNLHFVKTKRAIARNCLYDVYLIDYNNDGVSDIVSLIENKTKQKNVHTIKYDTDYLTTFTNILYKLDDKKDHYIWVCSSICDYTNFDFTYICDPFSLKQLHVFPSDKQKFGDTFFINVNDLHIFIEGLNKLENIAKINFNQHQRVKRLPAPSFVTETDTHLNFKQHSYNFPYAVFTTSDNLIASDINDEPISMWSKESKNILITNTGGTRIVVPKEANNYVEKELYDYPYIAKATKMGQSKPLDIVFLSNGETGADENYEHLLNVAKGIRNRVVRVDGVNGRVAAYHAAAMASSTPWMFTVFAKLKVNSKFDWTWQPDRLQVPKHYIFHAINPVNNLEYGHQAMIAYNKQITLNNMGKGLDFTLDNEHEVVEINSGVANYNTDEFGTWRTSFREAIKLKLEGSTISRYRLNIWSTVGEGDFAQYSIDGAKDAVEYYESVNGELDKLRLSYDWPWLQEYFNTKYN